MQANIVVLPGDGIGPEIIAATVPVLEAIARRHGHQFQFHEHDIGGIAIDRHGVPLPESTLEAARQAGLAGYSFLRHIEVLIAMMAEARMLPQARLPAQIRIA